MPRWILTNLSKNWGGGEKWTLTTAKALSNSGHYVSLIVYPGSHLEAQAVQANLSYFPVKARSYSLFNPFKVWRIFHFLQQEPFDAILLNSSHELKLLGILAKTVGIPRIIFRRGIPQPLKGHLLNRWYFRNVVNGMIANSQTTLQAMESIFSTEMSRFHTQVIYNGLDFQLWKREHPQQATKIVGVVGRLSYEKGIDRALHIFARIHEQIQEAQLWIVGQGEEESRLKQIAEELGLMEQVRFIGFTDNVLHYMQKFDVLLFPSRWEGFGYVLLEAMGLQIPPVAFDISTAKEIIAEGTGMLIPDNQLEVCADAVVTLLQNNELREQMGKNARIHAENQFSLSRVVEQLEGLLNT